jgi:hypothetical protein
MRETLADWIVVTLVSLAAVDPTHGVFAGAGRRGETISALGTLFPRERHFMLDQKIETRQNRHGDKSQMEHFISRIGWSPSGDLTLRKSTLLWAENPQAELPPNEPLQPDQSVSPDHGRYARAHAGGPDQD